MQINSINSNCRSNVSKQSFGARFTKNAEKELYKTGEYYLTNYGENSQRFKEYKDCVDSFKKLCPNCTMDIQRDRDYRRGTSVIKAMLYDSNGQKFQEYEFIDVSNVGKDRFNTGAMSDFVEKLNIVDTEIKEQDNPGYINSLLSKIIKG